MKTIDFGNLHVPKWSGIRQNQFSIFCHLVPESIMRLQLNQWSGKFDKTKYLHKVFVWSLPCVCNVCVCLSLDNALNRMYWNYCHMKIAIVENAVKILRASISQQTRPVARMAIKLNLLFFFLFQIWKYCMSHTIPYHINIKFTHF